LCRERGGRAARYGIGVAAVRREKRRGVQGDVGEG